MIHTLNIKARHFKNTYFLDNCKCPLAKSAKEQFKTNDVIECVDCIIINDKLFHHEHYDGAMFDYDKEKSYGLKFSDEVIRTIELI